MTYCKFSPRITHFGDQCEGPGFECRWVSQYLWYLSQRDRIRVPDFLEVSRVEEGTKRKTLKLNLADFIILPRVSPRRHIKHYLPGEKNLLFSCMSKLVQLSSCFSKKEDEGSVEFFSSLQELSWDALASTFEKRNALTECLFDPSKQSFPVSLLHASQEILTFTIPVDFCVGLLLSCSKNSTTLFFKGAVVVIVSYR